MTEKQQIAAQILIKQKDSAIEPLCTAIAEVFNALARLDPEAALFVLNSLNEQFDQDVCDDIIKEQNDLIEGADDE